MMTNIRFWLGADGSLKAEATPDDADVHFDEVSDTQYGPRVEITGNTYPVKDQIKAPGKDTVGYHWDGEVWSIRLSAVRAVIESCLDKVDEVTAEVETVEACDDLEEWHGEVDIEGPGDDKLIYRDRVTGPGGVCSLEWAKDAAELGNFDDVDEFVERFNLEVAPAEELEGVDTAEEWEDDGDVLSSG